MKIAVLAFSVLLCAALAARADEPIGFEEGMKLMAKYNCQSCHAVDKNSPGPSLRAIAKRYASNPHAQDELEAKTVNGSSGAWAPTGSVMPPIKVPQEDLKPLIEWLLSLR